MSSKLENPFLRNIGFMLTYKCTIACPHCIVEAGPHRKEEMKLEDALNWIEQARDYRQGHIAGIALTGGEPFYDMQKLQKVSLHAGQLGFIVSVVTNAYWASTKDAALKTLEKLPAIQIVSFSTDVYHQKAIPLENIKNGIWAAKQTGKLYNVAVCTDNQENPQFMETMSDLRRSGEQENVRVAITFPVGRAKNYFSHLKYETSCEVTLGSCMSANSPVVFPNGSVTACIGPVLTLPPNHPLYLGSLREETLAGILDRAEMNAALQTIRTWGPQKLVSLLKEQGMSDQLPKEYVKDCICDACYKLFSENKFTDALVRILQEEQFLKVLAYARVYYFNEKTMAERLQLTEKHRNRKT